MSAPAFKELPLPGHFRPDHVGQVWRVNYEARAEEARLWGEKHSIQPAHTDEFRICLLLIDVQNTFCIPGYELFVAGPSGMGAVDDNRRLCEFIYRNLGRLTHIAATLDTHTAMQIFHPFFLVDKSGHHPAPLTLISYEDIQSGRWRFNPLLAPSLGIDPEYGQKHLLYYTRRLKTNGKYDLTIWPYHAMWGSLGNALVPAVEEALFFHTIARLEQTEFIVKGGEPLTENYSVISPEVIFDQHGDPLTDRDNRFIDLLQKFDALIIAGQAKSHCVAWTVADLLVDIKEIDADLANKIFLLDDCASPVVVPGIIDYSQAAEQAYEDFRQAGMRRILSTDPISDSLFSSE